MPRRCTRGAIEDRIRREETAGAIELIDSKPRKRARGPTDHLLQVRVTAESQPVAVALIEAKAEHLPPDHGLEQAKLYAACKRLNVPLVFSTNGHLFVEFDRLTARTSRTRPLTDFPTPANLRPPGLAPFQSVFGADAAELSEDHDGKNHARNAHIHIATYQTLDVDKEEDTANFLTNHYVIRRIISATSSLTSVNTPLRANGRSAHPQSQRCSNRPHRRQPPLLRRAGL